MDNASLRETSARIDELLDELGQSTAPIVMDKVEELVHSVMTLYAAGLERTLDLAAHDPELVRRMADDEVLGNLLVLHDLHPDDVHTRVQAALDRVRPYLGSHAGGVALTGIDEQGIVHLTLEGSCDGCPSSSITVKNALEEAILQAAPDVVAVEAEGMVEAAPTLLQIQPYHERMEPAGDSGTGWHHLDLDVPPRTIVRVEVAGDAMLVANLDGTLLAYVDRCASCGSGLEGSSLAGDHLTCAACGHTFDLRLAGKPGLEGDGPLVPVPLLPEHGGWKAAVPQAVLP